MACGEADGVMGERADQQVLIGFKLSGNKIKHLRWVACGGWTGFALRLKDLQWSIFTCQSDWVKKQLKHFLVNICEVVSRDHRPGGWGGLLDVVVCHSAGWAPELREMGKWTQPAERLSPSSLPLVH